MTLIIKRKTRKQEYFDLDKLWEFAKSKFGKNLRRKTEKNQKALTNVLNKTFNNYNELYDELRREFGCDFKKGVKNKEFHIDYYGWFEEEYKDYYDRGPKSIRYWLKKGYSEDEAKIEITKYVRNSSSRCIEYWIKNGFSEEEAKQKISDKQKELSSKAARGPINSVRCIEYWIKNGFSEEEAKQKISDLQKSCSPRCKEYWISKGKSEEESFDLVKEFQTLNLEKFIEKYGEILGKEKYDAWRTSELRIETARKNLLKIGNGYSKSSQILFDSISELYNGNIFYATNERIDMKEYKNKEFILKFNDGSWIRPDFIDIDKKKIIEFDGEYWHNINGGDENRDEKLKKLNYSVLRIKETEFNKNPKGAIELCLKFLKN